MSNAIATTLLDAQTNYEYEVTITPDHHGLVIGIEGVEENIVLDVDAKRLRVFVANEHGEIQDDACAVLSLM